MGEDFKAWIARRLDTDESEPFCPFFGPEKVGYCDMAYSDECYNCEEAKGEWEAKKRELEN